MWVRITGMSDLALSLVFNTLAVITYVKHKPSNWAFTSSSVPWIELQTVSLILKCLVFEKLFFFKAGSHYVAPTGLELTKSTSYFVFFLNLIFTDVS